MVTRSQPFLRELRVGSYLIYPSGAQTKAQIDAKSLILGIKRDVVRAEGRLVEIVADRIRVEATATPLADLLDGTAVLVPLPGHARHKPASVWPALNIANALLRQGLARDVCQCLIRREPVIKSAYAAPGERPAPLVHYESFDVAVAFEDWSNIVLIDDVITRGATMSGAAARIRETHRQARIRGFAVARTEWRPETTIDPVVNVVRTSADGWNVERSTQ